MGHVTLLCCGRVLRYRAWLGQLARRLEARATRTTVDLGITSKDYRRECVILLPRMIRSGANVRCISDVFRCILNFNAGGLKQKHNTYVGRKERALSRKERALGALGRKERALGGGKSTVISDVFRCSDVFSIFK